MTPDTDFKSTPVDFRTSPVDLTVAETCSFFRVTAPTVYRLLKERKLEGYRLGGSRRVTVESIQRLRQVRS